MLAIDENTRVAHIRRVIRLYNGREPGAEMKYGTTFHSHELILKCSGENINTIDGVEYPLTAGTVLYIPKGTVSSYTSRTIQTGGETIDIFFDTDVPLADAPVLLPPPHRGRIHRLFDQCSEAWRFGGEERQLLCLGHLYGILGELRREQTSAHLPPDAKLALEKAEIYLREHCFDPSLSLPDLAQVCGMSYSYIKRMFLKQYGMPPVRYVTQRRMERARELLANPEHSVTQVSEMLGYSSVYYFSRVFRQETGMSPREYRLHME